MEEKQIDIGGKKIYYLSFGEGPTVILVHGFGEDGSVWNHQLEALKDFQVIIPDLPGSGKSEMIDDMSIEGMAESIFQLAIQISLKNFVMIGHSMGGYITLAFAEKYPEMLTAFCLFHSTAFADSEEKKEVRKKGIHFINKNGAFEFLKTTTPNLYSPVTKEKKPKMIEQQISSQYNFSNATLVSYYDSMMKRPDRTSVLKTFKMPVLFILGKYDNAVPLADGLQQCIMPHLSYIHILEHSGHMGMQEEPKGSNEIVINFIKSIHYHTQ
jgi:pimeloyl-ACP methyl ester carboxylesterase